MNWTHTSIIHNITIEHAGYSDGPEEPGNPQTGSVFNQKPRIYVFNFSNSQVFTTALCIQIHRINVWANKTPDLRKKWKNMI